MNQRRYDDSERALQESVEQALARSPYFAGRRLSIQVDHGDVVLTGVVETYYQKQLAQESVRAVDGVTQIHNDLEVMAPHWPVAPSSVLDVD